MKIPYYRYPHEYNVGDRIAPYILDWFLPGHELVSVNEAAEGKLVSVGSVMRKVKPDDVVWGTGIMRESDRFPIGIKRATFLAVRGPLTRSILVRDGADVPVVYGDPALLLPKMYPVENNGNRLFKVGIIPHYVDKKNPDLKDYIYMRKMRDGGDVLTIDVALPFQEFVNQILLCERIVSSSLHGIIIAEAYGVPAEWAVFSDKVIGAGFKFRDYFAGTGRDVKQPGPLPPIHAGLLETIQADLVKELQRHYGIKVEDKHGKQT